MTIQHNLNKEELKEVKKLFIEALPEHVTLNTYCKSCGAVSHTARLWPVFMCKICGGRECYSCDDDWYIDKILECSEKYLKVLSDYDTSVYLMEDIVRNYNIEKQNKMLQTHKTKEGEILLIAQMDDQHLINTINLMLDKIVKLKQALSAELDISPMKSAMYGIKPKELAMKAHKAIPVILNELYPYLSEALLRGGMGFTEKLQEILERKGQEDIQVDLKQQFKDMINPAASLPPMDDDELEIIQPARRNRRS